MMPLQRHPEPPFLHVPGHHTNDVVQGQTDVQDSLTIDAGGSLYIINAPVYVGGPNQPDHGHGTRPPGRAATGVP